MKKLLTFEEFVNESYNDEFLFENRVYFKEKQNPKLAAKYKSKVAEIVEEIVNASANLKGVQYAKKLTDIFGVESKEWLPDGKPNADTPNPMFNTEDINNRDCKNFKADPKKIEFIGWNQKTPWFSYEDFQIKVFVKTEDIDAVFGEWQAALKSIAKKYGISSQVKWVPIESGISSTQNGSEARPDTQNFLSWPDENMGRTIQDKKPELGYSYLTLSFFVYLLPTEEEKETFESSAKMKPVWNTIKKGIEPGHSAAAAPRDNPKWKVGKYELKDFILVWSTYEASEEKGVNWDVASQIASAIQKALGGQPIKSQADFAISGSEMRQAWQGTRFPYIVWDEDGTSIYVPNQELKQFEALCKDLKIAV